MQAFSLRMPSARHAVFGYERWCGAIANYRLSNTPIHVNFNQKYKFCPYH
ncbi:MAG: hypothetical protein RMX96_29855 [Nostoc sp. ChiSLP02]|nr:hypothetical protein [Nostoc sp. DedSLP05]MDZ8100626.1 hypothetical protein [Nostoc sp. DedSLP01]MDZ8189037.1 hypothetical protein [Nostoc sp. ChiSLP02]